MDRVVASLVLPHSGLKPRHLRQSPTPAAEEIEAPPGSADVVEGAGPWVDEVTEALRQRIAAATPPAPKRPTFLALSIAAGLAALRRGEP